jgi:hypothetical protein
MNVAVGFHDSVRGILRDARQHAYAQVNGVMVEAYWKIGRRIVEEEQKGSVKAGYGEALLQRVSRALTDEVGKGFFLASLKNFRQFYMTFPELEKSCALRSELSRTHYRLLSSEMICPHRPETRRGRQPHPGNYVLCRQGRNRGALFGASRQRTAFRFKVTAGAAQ